MFDLPEPIGRSEKRKRRIARTSDQIFSIRCASDVVPKRGKPGLGRPADQLDDEEQDHRAEQRIEE
ncbi:MAG: hypothetical protein ABWX67_02830, partial [Allosphingosinicella sp.]